MEGGGVAGGGEGSLFLSLSLSLFVGEIGKRFNGFFSFGYMSRQQHMWTLDLRYLFFLSEGKEAEAKYDLFARGEGRKRGSRNLKFFLFQNWTIRLFSLPECVPRGMALTSHCSPEAQVANIGLGHIPPSPPPPQHLLFFPCSPPSTVEEKKDGLSNEMIALLLFFCHRLLSVAATSAYIVGVCPRRIRRRTLSVLHMQPTKQWTERES